MPKTDILPCVYDPKCPEAGLYPFCDPKKPRVSRLCGKAAQLKEIPLSKADREFDRPFRK